MSRRHKMAQVRQRVGIVIVVLALCYGTCRAYSYVQFQLTKLNDASTYLFAPSGVLNEKGESLSRQQLLDFYLHNSVAVTPGLKFANGSDVQRTPGQSPPPAR